MSPPLPVFPFDLQVLHALHVRAAILGCGFHGAMEALSAGVPLLCIPFTRDQVRVRVSALLIDLGSK